MTAQQTDTRAPGDWLSDPHHVALERYYHALGVLQARWNIAELHFQQLAWFLMAAGPDVGAAVTFDMSNVARTNLILTLSRGAMEPLSAGFFEHCTKLFNRNRENRNFLAHCRFMHVSNAPVGALAAVQKFNAPGRIKARIYLLPLRELRTTADEIEVMCGFFSASSPALRRRMPRPSAADPLWR